MTALKNYKNVLMKYNFKKSFKKSKSWLNTIWNIRKAISNILKEFLKFEIKKRRCRYSSVFVLYYNIFGLFLIIIVEIMSILLSIKFKQNFRRHFCKWYINQNFQSTFYSFLSYLKIFLNFLKYAISFNMLITYIFIPCMW